MIFKVVGEVGCGKTSLCSAIIGEMEKIDGKINVNCSTAFASQQPWIQNATLKDNVLFGRPFDENSYKNVICSCALIPDLNILPAGDMTEIGEKVNY